MTFRFLHSSDLHLGRPFGGYPEAIRNRLREARHGAIARLASAARNGAAEVVLLAGDTFDAETPAPETLRQALRAMADEADVSWVLLPGNHDSLAAAELWRRIATDGPTNLRIIADAAPRELAPGIWLLPAPCTHRRPGSDLTESMSAPTPEGTRRIGLGHGAIMDFSGEEAAMGVIPPDRAARSGLDYLGLGDWHGQMQVAPGTWYSGTPEPDGFKHDRMASALLVALDGGQPQVTPVETGQVRWSSPRLDLLPGDDVALRLRDALPQAKTRDHLIRLSVTGRLPMSDHAALQTLVDQVGPDFGWFRADVSALSVLAMPEDLDQIDRAGALRQAAEALMAETTDAALSEADRATASRALSRLYALAQEVQA
jgi:DNA repair exonuclease SbcCD nuclease subunit